LNTFLRESSAFLSEALLMTTADAIAAHYHLIVYVNN